MKFPQWILTVCCLAGAHAAVATERANGLAVGARVEVECIAAARN
jgi:enamine deaminase RidA (YjgF/YER057c/UK114 family)